MITERVSWEEHVRMYDQLTDTLEELQNIKKHNWQLTLALFITRERLRDEQCRTADTRGAYADGKAVGASCTILMILAVVLLYLIVKL